MTDVVVLGAGLAGLTAARDLARGGADVLVLEARSRVGGRVEATTLPDGRTVELGGEVVGHAHTSYLELVEELGLSVEPSYVADPGEMSWGLHEGVFVGDEAPWMSARSFLSNRCRCARSNRSFRTSPRWRSQETSRSSRSGWTLATAACAWIIALTLGSLVGALRTMPFAAAVRFGNIYVELFRNVPLLAQMFLWYFVMPEIVPRAFVPTVLRQ